jgi:hypothetical protein
MCAVSQYSRDYFAKIPYSPTSYRRHGREEGDRATGARARADRRCGARQGVGGAALGQRRHCGEGTRR